MLSHTISNASYFFTVQVEEPEDGEGPSDGIVGALEISHGMDGLNLDGRWCRAVWLIPGCMLKGRMELHPGPSQ